MVDEFETNVPGLTSPGSKHEAITPDDTADLPHRPRMIYVGTGGDLVMRDEEGNDETWKNLPSGSKVAFRAVRVLEATTAEDLVAVW